MYDDILKVHLTACKYISLSILFKYRTKNVFSYIRFSCGRSVQSSLHTALDWKLNVLIHKFVLSQHKPMALWCYRLGHWFECWCWSFIATPKNAGGTIFFFNRIFGKIMINCIINFWIFGTFHQKVCEVLRLLQQYFKIKNHTHILKRLLYSYQLPSKISFSSACQEIKCHPC